MSDVCCLWISESVELMHCVTTLSFLIQNIIALINSLVLQGVRSPVVGSDVHTKSNLDNIVGSLWQARQESSGSSVGAQVIIITIKYPPFPPPPLLLVWLCKKLRPEDNLVNPSRHLNNILPTKQFKSLEFQAEFCHQILSISRSLHLSTLSAGPI